MDSLLEIVFGYHARVLYFRAVEHKGGLMIAYHISWRIADETIHFTYMGHFSPGDQECSPPSLVSMQGVPSMDACIQDYGTCNVNTA